MGGTRCWWSAYAEHYELLDVPVLLAEPDASLCWFNTAACGMGLAQAYGHAVQRHIFLSGDSTFFDELKSKSTIRLPLDEILENGNDYCLTALYEEEQLLGFTITVRPRVGAPAVTYLKGIERNISTFTYQTRAPLSAIFSAVSGILRCNNAEYEDPDLREYASVISTNSYRLLRTSMHIAQFYRFKYGETDFAPRQQGLSRFLEQLCRTVSVMVEAKGIRFSYRMPPEPVLVRFDATLVTMAVLELISNAAKFSGENGEITVAVQVGAESAIVSVTDNGLGIAQDIVGSVFDPYFSHNPRTKSICGDGLGLWLCRECARIHGGNIALESHEGEGTRVAFSLPLGGEEASLHGMRDLAADYLYDRFSAMYVILSDVCKVPEQ